MARFGSRMPDQFWAWADAQKQSTKRGKKNRNFRLILPRRNPRIGHSAVWGGRWNSYTATQAPRLSLACLQITLIESLPPVTGHSRHESAPAKTIIPDQ